MDKPDKKRVLLSSVCQPFGVKYGDGFSVTTEGSFHLLWAQNIFRVHGTNNQWGIDFIAQNLKTPTTTLHYPTMDQFIREIKKGYDYVGISFLVPTFGKMVPMVEAVRKYAPYSKVILGGYGTVLGERLTQYADYICDGEGVAFMRKLLGEDVDTPIEQPIVVESQYYFGLRSLPIRGYFGHIFAGLGCPNGCDFCATTAYFKRRHIKLLPDGASLVRAIQRIRERYPDIVDFWITDEDFLLDHKRGKDFLEAIRASNLPPLSIGIFSSVRAISQYSASELVEMGIERLWVGYEAKRAGLRKMEGRSYRELFADLHNHGISVLASMMIGFDYQDRETILEEFDELMTLRPSISQFLILFGFIGTPLHDRLVAEGRFIPEMLQDLRKHDGFYCGHTHPRIGSEELNQLLRELYRKEFIRLGPSIFRIPDDWITGYENLKEHPNARVRAKAQKYLNDALLSRPYLKASKRYLPPSQYGWIDNLFDRLTKAAGEPKLGERLVARTTPAVLWYADRFANREVNNQPKCLRREFPEKVDYLRAKISDVWAHKAMKLVRDAIAT